MEIFWCSLEGFGVLRSGVFGSGLGSGWMVMNLWIVRLELLMERH